MTQREPNAPHRVDEDTSQVLRDRDLERRLTTLEVQRQVTEQRLVGGNGRFAEQDKKIEALFVKLDNRLDKLEKAEEKRLLQAGVLQWVWRAVYGVILALLGWWLGHRGGK